VLIKALMLPKNELVCVSPDDSLAAALKNINERNFLSIPVVQGKSFLGLISKGKIYEEYFAVGGDREEFLNNTKVAALIRKDIPVLGPQDELEKAAHSLEVYGVPFVAVADERGNFEGIMTHYAIFKEFTQVLGINRGKKLSIFVNDIPGQIARISEIITRYHGDIISFVVIDPKVMTDIKEINVRVKCDNFVQLVDAIRHAGYRVQE
jgi:acetoin utilization protein AcuB